MGSKLKEQKKPDVPAPNKYNSENKEGGINS